jgi:hypothetical protein
MVRQIAPAFSTMDIPATLAYYTGRLGFECLGTWQDPPVYAIVARDQQVIHFRCAEPLTANPDKYADELLDAYLVVEDADALYAEYSRRRICSGTWQHAMALSRVRGEGLRWPSAGFRREPVGAGLQSGSWAYLQKRRAKARPLQKSKEKEKARMTTQRAQRRAGPAALQKTKRPDWSRSARKPAGLLPCPKTKKASSAKPGRTFLQH